MRAARSFASRPISSSFSANSLPGEGTCHNSILFPFIQPPIRDNLQFLAFLQFVRPHNLRNRPLVRTFKNQPVRLIQVASPLASTIANQIVIMPRQPPQRFKICSITNLSQTVNIALCTPLPKRFQCVCPIGSAFFQVFVFKKYVHANLKILLHLQYRLKF